MWRALRGRAKRMLSRGPKDDRPASARLLPMPADRWTDRIAAHRIPHRGYLSMRTPSSERVVPIGNRVATGATITRPNGRGLSRAGSRAARLSFLESITAAEGAMRAQTPGWLVYGVLALVSCAAAQGCARPGIAHVTVVRGPLRKRSRRSAEAIPRNARAGARRQAPCHSRPSVGAIGRTPSE
jgi:hypothetical protein